jgi:HK97 gp10 family phage protein
VAKIETKMPEDFLLKISKLKDKTDQIITDALEAGAETVVPKVKSNLDSVIGKDTKHPSRSTGELADALGVSGVKIDKNGNHNIKIGFSEPRKDGSSNAKIANILEYGRSNQPAKPFLKPARTATRKQCIEAMKQKLEREMENI